MDSIQVNGIVPYINVLKCKNLSRKIIFSRGSILELKPTVCLL